MVDDARRVAGLGFGIPYYVDEFQREFTENMIGLVLHEYRNGRTPNPCIACNRYAGMGIAKTGAWILERLYVIGGHYARIEKLENGGTR